MGDVAPFSHYVKTLNPKIRPQELWNFGILLAYADPDPFTSGAVNALRMFQDISAYLGTTITGMVYGTASEPGEIKNNDKLMKEAFELGEKLGK